MGKGIQSSMAWLALACVGAAPLACAQELAHIGLATPQHSYARWGYNAPFPARLSVPLEPGEDIYFGVLHLVSEPGVKGEYRVQVQFETSLAIGDEGPHLDLLDFKHCVSEWTLAATTDGQHYTVPAPSEQEAECFPEVSVEEIRESARKALAVGGMQDAESRWLDLLKPVRKPGDAPTFIGVSKIRVRVDVRRDGEWQEVATMEFLPAMGC